MVRSCLDHRQLGERSRGYRRPRRRTRAVSRECRADLEAGTPAVRVIGRELEALRHRHHAGAGRWRRCRKWRRNWREWRIGGSGIASASPCRRSPVPSPSPARSSAQLDIAKDADHALNNWEWALGRAAACWTSSERSSPGRRHRPRPDEPRRCTGRAIHFGEAKAELEECLQVFQNNSTASASVLSSLAILFYEQGDVPGRLPRRNAAPSRFASSCPIPATEQSRTTTSPAPRPQQHPVRPRRILPPSACRPRLSSRLRAGAGPPDVAAQLHDRLPPC